MTVPKKGSSMWVCGSTALGITSVPPASIIVVPARHVEAGADRVHQAAVAKHVGDHAGFGIDDVPPPISTGDRRPRRCRG